VKAASIPVPVCSCDDKVLIFGLYTLSMHTWNMLIFSLCFPLGHRQIGWAAGQ